ncbi:hypothetical protein NXH64_09245 [Butyrivibrio fibrisolvens]|uniref:hypothetical protein n=1 Tax=Pseudobutyrivibrio ruminis TaxID=46206 RepID=UPI0012DC6DE9|nr:hypothetical protein [Pseudobutyrivibrio ruminis]MDC7279685.1 hypothetical protein [Butyrivibrio fibrisolvens]
MSTCFHNDVIIYTYWQVFDPDDMSQVSSNRQYIDMSGGYMKVVISLPIKPSANNATSVSDDGKTLTWDLLSESNIH